MYIVSSSEKKIKHWKEEKYLNIINLVSME